jgi:hypothetical protein
MRPQTVGILAASSVKRPRYFFMRNPSTGYGAATSTNADKATYLGGYTVTRKINADGTHAWSRQITANMNCLDIDSADNVYVGGPAQAQIVKYDTNGNLQWQRYLAAGDSSAVVQGISVNSAGTEVYVAGMASSNTVPTMTKCSTDGSVVWSVKGQGSGYSFQNCAYDAANNVVYAAGNYYDGSVYYAYIVSFSGVDGSVRWQRISRYGTSGNTFGQSVAVGSGGHVYLSHMGGSSRRNSVVKIDFNGSLVWDRSIVAGASGNGFGTAAVAGDGSVLVSDYDANFTRIDASGNLLLQRNFTDTGVALYINLRGTATSDNVYTVMGNTAYKVPIDGTLTGTYGTLTYAATTQTFESSQCSLSSTGPSWTSTGYSATTSTNTVSASGFIPDVTLLG